MFCIKDPGEIPLKPALAPEPAPAPAPEPELETAPAPTGGLAAAEATDQSPFSKPARETVVLPAVAGQHAATIVWLHGLGDTGYGVSRWLAAMADPENGESQPSIPFLDLPHIKWIFPSAPVAPVTINRGRRAPSWYDVFGFNAGAPVDAKGIDAAARYVAGILEEEKKANPDVTYAVGGISQGGALSIYLMCRKMMGRFEDGSDASSVPLSASVAFSTWLPKCSLTPGPGGRAAGAEASVAERAANHPLLMTHGEVDVLVGYDWGRDGVRELQEAGFSNLTFHSYPELGHAMCPQEMAVLRAWLQTHLPPPA
ncbi:hypothetical protein CLOM_g16030 [Closterium sp. NIES-68]|nr:hypothetical protein CLOM_g16030 [Closterium sp. NIES-68]GJP65390.1 hypothetical protein CLOP_g22276 [Closterium sp. NIES-67]